MFMRLSAGVELVAKNICWPGQRSLLDLKPVILLPFLLLSACSTISPIVPMAQRIETLENPYPPITVLSNPASESQRRDCMDFDKKSLFKACKIQEPDAVNIDDELKASRHFEKVQSAGGESEYKLLISGATYVEDDAVDLAEAVLSGLTLTLLPNNVSAILKFELAVTWKDYLLKTYSYQYPFESKESLLGSKANENRTRELEHQLASDFLLDAQKDNIFSAEFIYAALRASDYGKDSLFPRKIGNYLFTAQHVFRHPFLGTQIRYAHKTFDFDVIDVFVYPIRSERWLTQQQALLEQEVAVFREELSEAQDKHLISALEILANENVSWRIGDSIYKGIKVQGSYKNSSGDLLETQMHLFVKKDKYVKFRSSFIVTENQPDVTDVIKSGIDRIDPPAESDFMRTLRKEYSKQAVSQR